MCYNATCGQGILFIGPLYCMSNYIFIVTSSFKMPVLQSGILTAVHICSSALGYFGNGVILKRCLPTVTVSRTISQTGWAEVCSTTLFITRSNQLSTMGNQWYTDMSHNRSYPPLYEILSKIKMNVKKTGTVIKYNGQEQD